MYANDGSEFVGMKFVHFSCGSKGFWEESYRSV